MTMRFLSSALCALLFSIPNPSFAQDTQSGVEQLRQFVRISKTAEGEFVQQQLRAPKPNEPQDKGLKVIRKTEGRFIFQRPGRFVWDTKKPFEQRLIADGKQLIMWDKDLNQATFRSAGQVLASTPAAILFGEGALEQHFDLEEGAERSGLRWANLKPKVKPSAGSNDLPYTSIAIGMSGGLPRALELMDGLGSVVQLSLTQIQLNIPLPAGTFTFTPPAGAEVLRLN
jgi:outer membrane lipoprotein carrier protein